MYKRITVLLMLALIFMASTSPLVVEANKKTRGWVRNQNVSEKETIDKKKEELEEEVEELKKELNDLKNEKSD